MQIIIHQLVYPKGIISVFDKDCAMLHEALRNNHLPLLQEPLYSRSMLQEDPDKTLIVAHIYLMDHIISTLWTVFFGVAWWSFTAHDGKRISNSPAQEEVATGGASYGHHPPILSETQRADAALELWNEEKNFAAGIIFAGWLIKVSHLPPISPSLPSLRLLSSVSLLPRLQRAEQNVLINHRAVYSSTS